VSISLYRRFSKAAHCITVLYEVTVSSYRLLYDSGRSRLRSEDAATAVDELRLEDRTTRRSPLGQLTYHAKDVYPQMLRSTLLIRLVAAYEAFLTDSLRELAERLDLSQAQLLSLAENQEVEEFIVDKTLRSLSSGGLKDAAKFYKKMSIPAEFIEKPSHLFITV
jgi:type VI protein secretion system component VasK